MLWLDVADLPIAVAGSGVDELLLQPRLPHQLLAPDAVLIGVLLKIKIVQQPHNAPEFLLLAVAELPGKVAHHLLHRPAVAQMEGVLIVFSEQRVCLLPGDCRFHHLVLPVLILKIKRVISL